MTCTINIPGGTAEFLTPDEITGRIRKAFYRAIKEVPSEDRPNLATVFFIKSWTLPLPLPNFERPETLEALDDLPVHLLDAMGRYISELLKQISPDFEPDPDPASPTLPSAV
jgi:hypothetical protein